MQELSIYIFCKILKNLIEIPATAGINHCVCSINSFINVTYSEEMMYNYILLQYSAFCNTSHLLMYVIKIPVAAGIIYKVCNIY